MFARLEGAALLEVRRCPLSRRKTAMDRVLFRSVVAPDVRIVVAASFRSHLRPQNNHRPNKPPEIRKGEKGPSEEALHLKLPFSNQRHPNRPATIAKPARLALIAMRHPKASPRIKDTAQKKSMTNAPAEILLFTLSSPA